MREMGDMTDEMLGHVKNLTAAFHQIDTEQKKANVVNPNIVKSALVHVQGTQSDVKEPAGCEIRLVGSLGLVAKG